MNILWAALTLMLQWPLASDEADASLHVVSRKANSFIYTAHLVLALRCFAKNILPASPNVFLKPSWGIGHAAMKQATCSR